MNNLIELLKTKFDDVAIITQYINYINENKLPNDAERSDTYYEIHHILPRSLFPEYEYEPTNLVKLKLYDHFVAHYIIAKTKNKKMLYAFNMMNRAKSIMNEHELDKAAKMYEELKADFVELFRETALNRPPMTQETKDKISKFTKGTIQLKGQRITKDEYYSNPEKYTHHCTGKTHSTETKQKMSDNGTKGKTCFHHIETLETRFEDESFSHPMWKLGNPNQASLAKDRFTNLLHWTNTVTNETTRSETCPGDNWVQKRTGFKNAFEGKTMVFDVRTGEKLLVDKSNLKFYHRTYNRILVETDTKIYTDIATLIAELNLPISPADLASYLNGKQISKKRSNMMANYDLSMYSITNPKNLKYPHNKEVV